MVNAFILLPDGRVSTDTSRDAIAAALADPHVRLWVDIEEPTEAQLALLADPFHFHALAIEDALHHAQRPKIEGYRYDGSATGATDYFYIVVHGPDLRSFHSHELPEIDIFLSERFLVTVHDQPFESITAVRNRAAADPKRALEPGVDLLLHAILDHLVDQYQPILDELDVTLDEIEEQALNRPTPQVLHLITAKKRELLFMRQIVGPQREVLAQLVRGECHFIRESTRIYLRDVQDHLIRVYETVELYRDLVIGARDIYLSSISNNLNQIMKTLTILSVIALPLTVITGFFGMNFDWIPGLHSQIGFGVAIVLMIGAVAVMLWWFRGQHWI